MSVSTHRRERRKQREEQEEMKLTLEKRICVQCGVNEIYQNIKTMNWCEPCIWEFVKDDSNN